MKISVVSPVYRAESIVDELVKRVAVELVAISHDFEIILVEDGGPDDSWKKILENCEKYPYVKGIKLSRNFGQHYAISAGIEKATGDLIVLMDCDLQDDPKFINNLLDEYKKGNEIVFTIRKSRKHGIIKKFNSRLYNKMFAIFSEKKYDFNAGSMVLFSRVVAKEFLKLKEKDRLYLQMLKWVGFKNTTIEVEHKERFAGTSSYSFFQLITMGIQGWTSHSAKLLRFSTYLGFILSLISFLGGISVIFRYFFFDLQPGWPSIIITILFSTGLILLSIGIAGIYIGKTFEQIKNRPLYIIEKEVNIND